METLRVCMHVIIRAVTNIQFVCVFVRILVRVQFSCIWYSFTCLLATFLVQVWACTTIQCIHVALFEIFNDSYSKKTISVSLSYPCAFSQSDFHVTTHPN